VPADDPRPALTAALVEALNERGSLIAYHADYERLRMEELAHDLPAHAAPLRAAIARLWDQEPIFRASYVDWRFEGRTSIKKVLPVLCPDLSYEGLDVASGTEAMAAWDAAVHGRDDDPEATFAALRAYCRQDVRCDAVAAAAPRGTPSPTPSRHARARRSSSAGCDRG
jgi:hypothetical protein